MRTENLELLERGAQMVRERGAREAGWMLVTGRPGEGKTTTLHHWGASIGAVFVTMHYGWTPSRMINALAHELHVHLGHDADDHIGEALLASDDADRLIVIDEAQFALRDGGACLERLRGITDKSGTPVVLVGMTDDVPKFSRREQISSRICEWVKFSPSTAVDVGKACAQLAEVEVAADLIEAVRLATGGRMRDVVNAIARIEIVGKALDKGLVSLADVRKTRTVLCQDYRTGIVPAPIGRRERGGA